jgi:hypothetical protein
VRAAAVSFAPLRCELPFEIVPPPRFSDGPLRGPRNP